MTNEQRMLELAVRCEAATGPDRELERDIVLALGWAHVRNDNGCDDDDYGFLSDPWIWVDETGQPQDGFPDYTASIDAAMTLVPEGMGWWVQDYLKDGCNATVGKVDSDARGNFFHHCHQARECKSAALALCAASLKAQSTDTSETL